MVADDEVEINLFLDYRFDIQELITWVEENYFKNLAIQLPTGLRLDSYKLISLLENELGISIILLADPCFGACDLPDKRIEQLSLDGIAHFGHAEIPSCPQGKVPVKYFELRSKIIPSLYHGQRNKLKIIRDEFKIPSKIGLLTTIQYINSLDNVKSELEQEGFRVKIGSGDERIKYNGQVLGCNFSTAKSIMSDVSGFLFIGDGQFHPLGVALVTDKAVLAFDPLADKIQNIVEFKEKILRQRSGAIAKAKECSNFGIIVTTKPGQNRFKYALKIKEKLQRHKHHGTLITMDNITPETLDYLPFQAYINTACPRLTIDDYLIYKKTMITPIELEIALGEKPWECYQFDELL